MNQDLEHLRWLSIGFYVNAAVTALFSCIPFIHLFLGIAVVSGSFDNEKSAPPALFGWFFVGIASILIISGFTLAICNFLAGTYLKQHRRHTFCLVIGAVNCMFMPLGTVLGVFTIIVLVRDSVRNLFNPYNPARFDTSPNNPAEWR